MDDFSESEIKPHIPDTTTGGNLLEVNVAGNISETDKLPVFMKRFWDSDIYTQAYDRHYEGKNISPKATIEMKRAAFEGADSGIQALVNFYKEKCKYRFNPLAIDDDVVRDAFMKYKDAFSQHQKALNLSDPSNTRADLAEKDANRDLFHGNLAEKLLKAGLVNNVAQGRILGHIAMVSLGYEKQVYYDPEERKNRARIKAQNNANAGNSY